MQYSVRRKLNKLIDRIYASMKHRFDVLILYLDWLFISGPDIRSNVKEVLGKNSTVSPLNVRKWHNGTSVFVGYSDDGDKIFIKRSFKPEPISAEVASINKLQTVSVENGFHVCSIIFKKISGRINYIFEDFIDAKPLSDKAFVDSLSESKRIEILSLLFKIVNCLQSSHFIHCDFTPKNILISEDGSIHLIDFEYSIFTTDNTNEELVDLITSNNKKLLALGDQFSLHDGFIDDGYALLAICKKILPNILISDYQLWRKINLSIGRVQLDIKQRRVLIS